MGRRDIVVPAEVVPLCYSVWYSVADAAERSCGAQCVTVRYGQRRTYFPKGHERNRGTRCVCCSPTVRSVSRRYRERLPLLPSGWFSPSGPAVQADGVAVLQQEEESSTNEMNDQSIYMYYQRHSTPTALATMNESLRQTKRVKSMIEKLRKAGH